MDGCKRPPSISIGIGSRNSSSVLGSCSCNVDNALQSKGLHNPKSDNFMCPFLSSNKLSGLMSLQHQNPLESNDKPVKAFHLAGKVKSLFGMKEKN